MVWRCEVYELCRMTKWSFCEIELDEKPLFKFECRGNIHHYKFVSFVKLIQEAIEKSVTFDYK
jgi:hypothetical protein